jgi:hypothetical protein
MRDERTTPDLLSLALLLAAQPMPSEAPPGKPRTRHEPAPAAGMAPGQKRD